MQKQKIEVFAILSVHNNNCFFLDINECTVPSHNCHDNATCFNEPATFRCDCNSGFEGNGVTCTGKN